MEHLAYCDKKAKELEKILNGEKSMLIRGAAGRKLPYGRVFPGEVIYLIENDGKGLVVAKGKISKVINSDRLMEGESEKLIDQYRNELSLTGEQIKRWTEKKYLCLVGIKNVMEIQPFTYERSGNMDDWIIVSSINEIKRDL